MTRVDTQVDPSLRCRQAMAACLLLLLLIALEPQSPNTSHSRGRRQSRRKG